MSVSMARASRIASSCPKDFDFQFFIYQNEDVYPMLMSPRRIINGLYALPKSEAWNALLCVLTLLQIVIVSLNYDSEVEIVEGYGLSYTTDVTYNVVFLLDIVGRIMNDVYECIYDRARFKFFRIMWYILDFLSFSHYVSLLAFASDEIYYYIVIACYYERLHRPIGFLWTLLDYYMIGHIFFSFLKFLYFFLIIRIIYANFFVWIGSIKLNEKHYPNPPSWLQKTNAKLFFRSYYFMTQLFDSIRPDTHPTSDEERMWHSMVMMTGTLGVTAISIAAMAIIISIYMRPEEIFRARFRLIMNEMKITNVPLPLREKVDTFYRMYWLKQKAVSVTQLLPCYPPTISNAIYTDIYFEAQQKSRVLRDLSYQFLSEIARCMQTINYIPGDTIVKRNTTKCSIIYIAYGDVEMLTAEDDDTPILRFTRGSIINPCGASVKVASTLAHVGIRAATFCTAHVLKVADMWKVAAKIGKSNGQNFILLSSFNEHLDRVKAHYANRSHPPLKYKSAILLLKRNLMELKGAKDADDKSLLARSDVFLELAGCYIMRNSEDTKLTQESDTICLRPTFPCILQPMSSLLVAWQILICVVAIFVVFVYPYVFVHLEEFPHWFGFVNAMVTFIYILDIVTHLSIGAKIEEGVPITFTHTSMKQIQSIWFVIDVFCVAPFFTFIHNGEYSGMTKLLKIVKVFHTLKHFEEVWINRVTAFRCLSYGLLIILMFYMGAIVKQALMCTMYHFCEVTNLQLPPYWSESNKSDENIENRIMFGMYWSISLMTYTSLKTFGIAARYWSITLIVLGLLLACSILHIMIQATSSATIMVSETMRVQYELCIETVKEFLSKNNVDAILKQRFISYLQLCWYTDKAYSINHEKTSILYDLPQHVYQDILAMQRSRYLLCIPFMKFVNKVDLKVISARARLFHTSPNEILLNTGDISNEIYVIKQGFCEILSPVTKEVIALITAKSHFGDVECLLRVPAFYTVRAVTHVQIFSISRKFLMKAIAEPKIRDAILHAKQHEVYSLCMKRQEQFVFYEPPLPPPNRELFPLPRKHEPDVAFLLPFNRLGFLSVLRYVFPRYTIRPDGKYLARFEKFRAICAFLTSLIFPVYTMLLMQFPCLWYFSWALDIVGYYDIVQRMLVGYFDEKGVLVYHPASTAAYYIKGAFLVDLMGCLPLELLDSVRTTGFVTGEGFRLRRTPQYLMFNRLVQLYRVPNALDFLNDYTDRDDIVFIIKYIPVLLGTLIILSSYIMLVSTEIIQQYTGGYEIRPVGKDPSWMDIDNAVGYAINATVWNLFLSSLYWSTYEITTTGFNVFVPTNRFQLYYLVLWMLVGSMLTTYFSVRVISIRANVHQSLASFQENMKDILTFMKKEKLSKELHREVVSYYEYMWDRTGGTDYNTVLKMCDQITLRTDAILHIYGHTFSKCPILYRCEQSLLRLMGRSVRSVYFRQDMMIIERDEVASDLYFLDYGTVEVREEDDETILTKLPRGSMFGNLDNKETALSARRIVANSNVHLLKINSVIFYTLIQDFPTVKQLLKKFRPNNETYIIGGTKTQVMAVWKEHAVSSALIVVTREGFVKYLNDHSTVMQIYLMIISLACIILDIHNAGFQYNQPWVIGTLYTLDVLFVMKIIVNYVLPLVTEEGSRNASETSRRKYVKGEFKYDLVSVLPMELFCLLHKNPWACFPQLRINRIFRTVTLYNCLKQYRRKLSINRTFTTIAILLLWFSLLVHAITCFWYYIGSLEEDKEFKSSWRYTNSGTALCGGYQYLCSLYFVLTMFTHDGVGDILPRQHVEVAFVIVLMIFCKMFYMIIVGELTNILQYQSYRCFGFYSKYIQLQAFLKNNRVSKNLTDTAKSYTLHLWREARGLQEPVFVKAAPPCLRLHIMSAAYMEHLSGHPIFQQCEPPFLRHLVGCLQPFYYSGSMYVVREGDITNAMYFIHRGSVDKLDEDMDQKLQVFRNGQSFGAFQGLNRGCSYTYSYKTIVPSQVLALCLDNWEYLLKHFPKSKEIIFTDRSNASDSSPPPPAQDKKKKVHMPKLHISQSLLHTQKSVTSVGKSKETMKSLTDTASKIRQTMSMSSKVSSRATPSSTSTVQNTLSTIGPTIEDNRPDDFPNKDEVEDTLRAAYSRRKSVTVITKPPESEIITTPSEQPTESHPWPIDSRSESPDISPETPTNKGDNKSKDKSQTAMPSTVKEDKESFVQKDYEDSKPGYSGLKSTETKIDTAAVEDEIKKQSSKFDSQEDLGTEDNKKLARKESDDSKPAFSRIESTEKNIDKAAVDEELKKQSSKTGSREDLGTEDNKKLMQKENDDPKPEFSGLELTEKKIDKASVEEELKKQSSKTDSRKDLGTADNKKLVQKENDDSKPALSRIESTEKNVDKAGVEEELKKQSSKTGSREDLGTEDNNKLVQKANDDSKPAFSRLESIKKNVDKATVKKELNKQSSKFGSREDLGTEDKKKLEQKGNDYSKPGISGLKSTDMFFEKGLKKQSSKLGLQEDLRIEPSGITKKPSTPKVTPTLMLTPISAPIPSLAPLLKMSSSIPPGTSNVQTLALSVTNVSVPPEAKASLKMKFEEQSVKKTTTTKLTIASKDTTSDSEEDQKVTDVEKAATEARKRIRKPTVFNVNKDAIMEELKALSSSDEISDIETKPKAITLPSVQPATIEPSDRNDVQKDMLEKQPKLKDTVILPVRDDLNISSQSAYGSKQDTTTTTQNEPIKESIKKDFQDSMPDKTSQKEDKSNKPISEELEQSTLLISVSLLSPKEQVEVPTSMTDLPVASRSDFNQQSLGTEKEIEKVLDTEKNKIHTIEMIEGVSKVQAKDESQTAMLSSIKEENENLLQKDDKISPTLIKNSSLEPSPAPKTNSLTDIVVEESVPKSTSGTEHKTKLMLLNDILTPEPETDYVPFTGTTLSSKAKSASTPIGAPTSILSSASQTVVTTKTAISSPTLTSKLDNGKEPMVDYVPLQTTIPTLRRTTADNIPATDFILPQSQMSNPEHNLLQRSTSAPVLVDTPVTLPSKTLSRHIFSCTCCKAISDQSQSEDSFRPRYLETIIPSLAPTASDRIPLSALLPPRLFTTSPQRSLQGTTQKTKLVEKDKSDSSMTLTYKPFSPPEQVGSDVNPLGDVEYFSPKDSAAEIILAHPSKGGVHLVLDTDTVQSDIDKIFDKQKEKGENIQSRDAKLLLSTVTKQSINAQSRVPRPPSKQPAGTKPGSSLLTTPQPTSAQLASGQSITRTVVDTTQPARDQLASVQPMSARQGVTQLASAPPNSTQTAIKRPDSPLTKRDQQESVRPNIIQPTRDPRTSAQRASVRPDSTQLTTGRSDITQLTSVRSDMNKKARDQPATVQPMSTHPGSTQPASLLLDSTQPATRRLISTQPASTQPTRAQPTGAQLTGAQPTGAQPTGAQLTSAQPTGAQPTGAQPTGAQPTYPQPVITKPARTQPANAQPTSGQPIGTPYPPTYPQAVSTQPVSALPTGAQPTYSHAVSTQPVSAVPESAQPTSAEARYSQEMGVKPTGAQPTEAQPQVAQLTGAQPMGTQPMYLQAESTQPTGAQPTGAQATDEPLKGAQSAGANQKGREPTYPLPASTQPASAQPVSAQPVGAQATNAQPASAQPTSAQPASAQPASAQPASAQPASAQSASAQPASAQPASAQPASSQPEKVQPTYPLPVGAEPAQPTTAQQASVLESTQPASSQPPSAVPASALTSSVLPESVPSTSKVLTNEQGSQALKIFSLDRKSSLEEVELRKIAYSGEGSSAKVPDSQYPATNIELPIASAPEKRVPSVSDYKKELDVKLTDQTTKSSRFLVASESLISVIDEPVILTELDTVKEKSFLNKIKSMVSKSTFDTDEMYGEGVKDHLLIEQDLEATNALISKYKERKRSSAGAAPIKGAGRVVAKEQSEKDKKGFEFKSRRSVRYIGPKDAGSQDELEEDEDGEKKTS